VEVVLEAIDYRVKNRDLLDAERAHEDEEIQRAGRGKWPYAPADGSAQAIRLYL
jgi:hypothetical protein